MNSHERDTILSIQIYIKRINMLPLQVDQGKQKIKELA